MKFKLMWPVVVLAALQGCTTEPVKTEADFGKSVRQMIAVQSADSPAAPRPSGLDGRQAEKVLQAYRGAVARPQDLKTDVNATAGK